MVRHAQARFLVPNELARQASGQRQDRGTDETLGVASYQHIFSADLVADARAMARDNSDTLASNLLSTPIFANQDRGFRGGYFRAWISAHHNNQDWKAGVEADSTSLRERFNYTITDFSQFDPGTPSPFSFRGQGFDLEQSAFVQDVIRLRDWTLSGGLRSDHYQLLVNQNALSPRIGLSRYFAESPSQAR
ncbi:MAG TPA: TonB-dependent receptor [Terriglobales bacterium]